MIKYLIILLLMCCPVYADHNIACTGGVSYSGDVRFNDPADVEVVANGFVGYVTARNDTCGNMGASDGPYQTFTVDGTGTKTFSRIGFVANNTDTAKHFAGAIYSSDKSTKLGYTGSTLITSNNNWNYMDLVSSITIEGGTSVVLIVGSSDDNDWAIMGESTGSATTYYDGTWAVSDATIDEANGLGTTDDLAIFADNGQTTPS